MTIAIFVLGCSMHAGSSDLVSAPVAARPPAAWVWTPQGGTLQDASDALILWVGTSQDAQLGGHLLRLAAALDYEARPASAEDLRQSWPVAFLEERQADRVVQRDLRVDARSTGHPALVRLAVELLARGEASEATDLFGARWVEATL